MDPVQAASYLQADHLMVSRAYEQISDGTAMWIVVSGKMCSGKDTVAPLVLPALGYSNAVRVGYSDPMRAELQVAIDVLTGRSEPGDVLAKEIEGVLLLKPEHALELVELVHPSVKDPGHGLTGASRTEAFRTALQKDGSTWRCEEDEAYWSKRVSVTCLEHLAEGVSVYLTGGRFEPDVSIPQMFGAKIVRLDVSPEVQRERLKKRDGIEPDPAAVNHPGETALDDWEHFDVRILNHGTLEEGLEAVVRELRKQREGEA